MIFAVSHSENVKIVFVRDDNIIEFWNVHLKSAILGLNFDVFKYSRDNTYWIGIDKNSSPSYNSCNYNTYTVVVCEAEQFNIAPTLFQLLPASTRADAFTVPNPW